MANENHEKNQQAAGTEKGSGAKMVWLFILGIIVGIALAFVWQKTAPAKQDASNISEDQTATSEIQDSGQQQTSLDSSSGSANFSKSTDVIEVKNQDAGEFVSISKVNLSKKAWVAIYETDSSGKPTRILGARLFSPSEKSGNIELLRNTDSGKTYYAIVHEDNGDGKFDKNTDPQMKDSNGDIIFVKFETNQ